MLADAQRDGRPAERRWRSLFNAALSDFLIHKFVSNLITGCTVVHYCVNGDVAIFAPKIGCHGNVP